MLRIVDKQSVSLVPDTSTHPLSIARVRRISGGRSQENLALVYHPIWWRRTPTLLSGLVARLRFIVARGEVER